MKQIWLDGIMGVIVGDALGLPVQFQSRRELAKNPVTDMRGLAHLLFDNASKTLLSKIEQVVKLIRSKGVGIYFITQSPKDIPDDVLAQLGNKVQHALRAYTPAEQKAVKAAAVSFRENEAFDTYEEMTQLGVGEALISVLDEEGIPTIVKSCKILPPQSQMGALEDAVRTTQIQDNLLYTKYVQMVDRESAYEILKKRVSDEAEEEARAKEEAAAEKLRVKEEAAAQKQREKEEAALARQQQREVEKKQKQLKSTAEKVANSASGTIGRELGNQIGNSIGGKFGKKIGGNVGATLARGIMSTLFRLK